MLRLRDKFSHAAFADSVTPATRFVGSLIALLIAPTVSGFLLGWAAAEILTATAYWIFVGRSGDLGLMWRTRLDHALLAAENPGIARFAVSTNVSSSIGLSSKQVPLLLVGAYVGPAAAGAFRIAFQLAQALTKLSQLLARAAFPEIVRTVHALGNEGLRGLLGRLLLGATIGAAIILVIVTLLGQPMLVLVGGHAYAQAYPILLWLAGAGCMDLATTGFEPILMAIHRAGTASMARAAAAIVLLALMVMLTPTHGAIGAAAAVLAGSMAAAILLGIAAFRFVGHAAGT
jgi:O-antigen/teichoic acid export membrane protein